MPGRHHLENILSEYKINESMLYLYEREHEGILEKNRRCHENQSVRKFPTFQRGKGLSGFLNELA